MAVIVNNFTLTDEVLVLVHEWVMQFKIDLSGDQQLTVLIMNGFVQKFKITFQRYGNIFGL